MQQIKRTSKRVAASIKRVTGAQVYGSVCLQAHVHFVAQLLQLIAKKNLWNWVVIILITCNSKNNNNELVKNVNNIIADTFVSICTCNQTPTHPSPYCLTIISVWLSVILINLFDPPLTPPHQLNQTQLHQFFMIAYVASKNYLPYSEFPSLPHHYKQQQCHPSVWVHEISSQPSTCSVLCHPLYEISLDFDTSALWREIT